MFWHDVISNCNEIGSVCVCVWGGKYLGFALSGPIFALSDPAVALLDPVLTLLDTEVALLDPTFTLPCPLDIAYALLDPGLDPTLACQGPGINSYGPRCGSSRSG